MTINGVPALAGRFSYQNGEDNGTVHAQIIPQRGNDSIAYKLEHLINLDVPIEFATLDVAIASPPSVN